MTIYMPTTVFMPTLEPKPLTDRVAPVGLSA